ncbi:regulator of nonsense transcripts 2-like isoform X2 [Anneissia japonica]|uniref:regulator of nonsense transcripts 2-like isoform X2 n=1 Tax=Anneissia japonica TaxID=1529436 RepID=UPI0014257F11|nr:regulator of nonsense transcripts 2-like isoform X2 [Anneissia japonica]
MENTEEKIDCKEKEIDHSIGDMEQEKERKADVEQNLHHHDVNEHKLNYEVEEIEPEVKGNVNSAIADKTTCASERDIFASKCHVMGENDETVVNELQKGEDTTEENVVKNETNLTYEIMKENYLINDQNEDEDGTKDDVSKLVEKDELTSDLELKGFIKLDEKIQNEDGGAMIYIPQDSLTPVTPSGISSVSEEPSPPSSSSPETLNANNNAKFQANQKTVIETRTVIVPRSLPEVQKVSSEDQGLVSQNLETKAKSPKSYSAQRSERPARGSRGARREDEKARARGDADKGALCTKPVNDDRNKRVERKDKSPQRNYVRDRNRKSESEEHKRGSYKDNQRSDSRRKDFFKQDDKVQKKSDNDKEQLLKGATNKSEVTVIGKKVDKEKNIIEPSTEPDIASQSKLKEEKKEQEDLDAKLKEQEEAKQREEEEEKHAKEIEAEVKDRIAYKMKMRDENLRAPGKRPDEDSFHKLDSSLKKNTAFIKKLKMMGDHNRDSLVNDLKSLNLTKYIGEVASGIYEAKLKMSDVPLAISISSILHQRFADFAPQLLQNFQKNIPQTPKKEEKDSQPIVFDSKVRVEIRLLAELIVHGVFTDKEGLPVLNILLSSILKSDRENHANISIIISFVKHCGEDFAGLVPRKNRTLVEKFGLKLPTSEVFSSQVKSLYRNLLKDHYAILAKHLVRQHKDLQNRERQNRKILQTKGELSEERKRNIEETQVIYQKLLVNTTNLSDLLDLEMPDLPEDEKLREERENDLIGMFGGMKSSSDFDFETSLWEDEDTRTFHENLTDLRTIVPAILFKDNSKQQAPGDQNEEEIDKVESVELPEEDVMNEGKEEVTEEPNEVVEEETEIDDTEEEEAVSNVSLKMQLESFLQRLHTCVNREFIDSAAVEFVMNYNTKANRKKLVKTLFNVPRTRLDLLSFYSRLVATLFPCMPDVATDLVDRLKADFKYHVKKKDQINIESKIKTVRFIGELTKFKMCPKADTLQCLKVLLSDFRHHNIDMTCALLEVCGRFLYRTADSFVRTNALLEQMMRKKTRLHLNDRYETMVENAFFFCNPPETKQAEVKVRPPMHQYIRKLLFKDLTKLTVEKTLRQIRKLPWTDPDIEAYATKCLALVWNVKYSNIHCIANLVAGLVAYHDNVGIMVVDSVMEDIRLGMELNLPELNQRRVSMVKYLGELYNYRMVESAVVFKTLYTLIKFGISLDGTPTQFDPPEHLFRIRLVCTLLDTCGQFFDRGSTKKKLDCFLVYFQQYVLYKKSLAIWDPEIRPFPMDVDNMISDTLEALRPKMKMLASLEESNDEVLKLQNEYIQKLSPVIVPSVATSYQPGQGLTPILESHETDSTVIGTMSSLEDEDYDSDIDFSDNMDRASTGGSQGQSLSQCLNQPEPVDEEDDVDITLDSAGEEEDEDSVTLLKKRPRLIDCPEDEDFTSAFDKMMAETTQHRSSEVIKVPQFDVSVPVHMKRSRKSFTFLQTEQVDEEEEDKKDTINFTLVVRKGNKQQFKGFEVPMSSHLVANLKNREQAELAEKQRVKQITLDINERQEEEEYQETISQMTRVSTVAVATPTRERKPRFYHPKGAPDSDQIFNSTGNRKW